MSIIKNTTESSNDVKITNEKDKNKMNNELVQPVNDNEESVEEIINENILKINADISNNNTQTELLSDESDDKFSDEDAFSTEESTKMIDGTDLSSLEKEYRDEIIDTTESVNEIYMWHGASKLANKIKHAENYSEPLEIFSNGFTFPDQRLIYGYIVKIDTRVKNYRTYLYLNIAIAENDIRTIKCCPSQFSDPIRMALHNAFGATYTLYDLKYRCIRLFLKNTLDDEGNVKFTKVLKFGFLSEHRENSLKEAYKVISNQIF